MSPAIRSASLPDALAAFAAQSEVILSWAAGRHSLGEPSQLPGWSIRDVLAHLTGAVERLRDASPTRGKPLPVADYVAGYEAAAGEIADAARGTAGDPRDRLAAACAGVADRQSWPAALVMWSDPLASADAVVTRTLELVVHGLDLGIEPDRTALGLTVRALTGILATRHPGRAVELRVAPYAAVQVREGTVHRRGTPTAVVSCDPVPWVRLATGRLSWAEAETAGSLTARGERSDLSAYLPLLS